MGVPTVQSVQLPNNRPIKTPPLFFPKTLKAHHVVTFPDRSRKNNVNVIPSRWKPQEEKVSHISDTFRQAPQAGAQQQRQGGRRHPPSPSPSPPSHSPPPSSLGARTRNLSYAHQPRLLWCVAPPGRARLRSSFGSSGSAAVLSRTGRVVCAEFLVKPKIGAESRVFRSKTGLETQDFFFPHWVRSIFSQYHLLQRLEYSNQSRCM